ncbi:MAG: hypothetical protein GF355_11340 [Candidatus Eisenbacteria bacterium]|nr:hypothetical protein [Candidatus Eisenbacteria bacterium]
MIRSTPAALVLAALAVSPAFAATYVVRPDGTGDFPTIQAAISAAVDGDVIELGDGVFTGGGNRDLDYMGKAITIRSESGIPATCVIDCEGSEADPHRGFFFHSAEGLDSELAAVTVRNGYAPAEPTGFSDGGGVFCYSGSSPTIRECILENNYAGSGGAISFYDYSTARLLNCTIRWNAAGGGAGIVCDDLSSPTISGCTIIETRPRGAVAG